jgi:four helix bundle protein
MNTSQGSLEECCYYLILSKDLGFGDNESLQKQIAEVSKLLESYTTAILSRISQN